MASLIDISPLISSSIAVWPGDTPFRRTVNLSLAGGDNLELSEITGTVHLGAHVDAPSHYVHPGEDISQRSLDRYYGLCQVITVRVAPGARIMPSDVEVEITAPRVLLHTGSYPDPDCFNTDFSSLSPELVAWLSERGVGLVGIDTPSIDPFTSKALESHAAVAARDMAVLEGVVLHDVPDGFYTLIALPLRLSGADASPVRAALIAL
ncbi:MAG: arylformamidase [Myxococcota bacterium]